MDRNTARQEIRDNWEPILQGITHPAQQNVNGRQSYVCPICGHGEHGDGLTINPRGKHGALKCFGCNFSGDIIDLLQQVNGCDFNTALQTAAAELGITIDRGDAAADFNNYDIHNLPLAPVNAPQRADREKGRETPTTAAKSPQQATGADYRAYYKECRDRLNDPAAVSYLQARGISIDTAARHLIGYDPQADPANAPGAMGDAIRPHPTPRIIIPTSRTHYVGRSIDPATPKAFQKLNPNKDKGASSPGIFNGQAIYSDGTVFVVEGAFDALSILEAGGAAIATNSKNNGQLLLDRLKKKPAADTRFIICPDNDPDPKTNANTQATAQKLCDDLRAMGYCSIVYNVSGDQHDANDALRADRSAFAKAVIKGYDLMREEAEKGTKPENVGYYIRHLMGADLARFKNEIKTGFNNLDQKAGGLYPGLYVIAAISSLGKTTFTHQMADNIAAAGNDVLFFSLEQSRLELVTKSIARWTAKKDLATAVTSLAIRKGYLPQQVKDAAQEYAAAVGDRFSVIEGNFNCTVSFIGNYIRGYMARNKAAETGSRPVVIIDYLQVIAADKDPETGRKMTETRQIVDHNITELKRISRDLDITVILVSSVNRANYMQPIDFESLKESGGIEYTSDVIWGLQLQCLNDPLFDKEKDIKKKRETVKKAKAANPRKIELVCLKNRYGISSYCCGFNYYPAADLFTEDAGADFNDYDIHNLDFDAGENDEPIRL
jgi:replicative DNA helicase